MRRSLRIFIALVTVCVTFGVFWGAQLYFRSAELLKADGRLSLYQSSVNAEFERFSHLPYVLARDPLIISTVAGADPSALNPRLADFAARAGLDAIYLMDRDGLTIAASNYADPASFIGQTYSFRPYFSAALSGAQGRFYAIGATTGQPGYFIADPVRDAQGEIAGVIAIKIDLSALEDSWSRSGEQIILSNDDGVVLLSSAPAWRYRTLRPLSQSQRDAITASRQFTGQPLDPLDWQRLPRQRAKIDGEDRLYLTSDALPHGWELHYFAAQDRATVRSWLVTASLVFLAGLAVIAMQIQRTRRVGAALARSEANEAELRAANAQLAVEIEDRRTAERRLKRTQGELERAGRLAALGQLAASVTHELGQPIAAMRNHLAATEITSGHSPLTTRLQGLVDRMEGITRQLKFFARKGRDNFEDVDLRDAMRASLELVAPNIAHRDVTLNNAWPDTPVMLFCNRLRIEQVMTNLLRNAIDAVDEVDAPQIDTALGHSDGTVWFSVQDNGHGLGESNLSELSEPFTTTRESGHGMGLGLAISTVIVDDHNGQMSAENNARGGAVFTVTFPQGPDGQMAQSAHLSDAQAQTRTDQTRHDQEG